MQSGDRKLTSPASDLKFLPFLLFSPSPFLCVQHLLFFPFTIALRLLLCLVLRFLLATCPLSGCPPSGISATCQPSAPPSGPTTTWQCLWSLFPNPPPPPTAASLPQRPAPHASAGALPSLGDGRARRTFSWGLGTSGMVPSAFLCCVAPLSFLYPFPKEEVSALFCKVNASWSCSSRTYSIPSFFYFFSFPLWPDFPLHLRICWSPLYLKRIPINSSCICPFCPLLNYQTSWWRMQLLSASVFSAPCSFPYPHTLMPASSTLWTLPSQTWVRVVLQPSRAQRSKLRSCHLHYIMLLFNISVVKSYMLY